MSKQKNPIWSFFASVKLALATLIILAITSIIGTIIKQAQSPDYYLNEYGESVAHLFDALQLTHMYSSWWYISLLAIFSINLLVCSLERLPAVWRLMTPDNQLNPPQKLEKMSLSYREVSPMLPAEAAEQVSHAFVKNGWKSIRSHTDKGVIRLFVQKGAWSRLGVYVVHFSILIVLAGAILGGLYGFQAYVYLPEGRTTEQIFKRYTKEPYQIGYGLRCDRVEKIYYPNGMVKQYHADLAVLDPERKTPFLKSIIVNDPLSYKGLSYYLGDALPTKEFFIEIINRDNGMRQAFRIPPEQEIDWPEAGLWVQVEELEIDQDGNAIQGKIAVRDNSGTVSTSAWIADKNNLQVSVAGQNLDIYFRQMRTTLLLITKDPGVSIVYTGCILLVIGLAVSFFFAHRRIWVEVTPHNEGKSLILVGGISNKNKLAFEQAFHNLGEDIDAQLASSSESGETGH